MKALWFDGLVWRTWKDGGWRTAYPDDRTKIEYLSEKVIELNALVDNYLELEELVRDFVNERPTDKWVLKVKPVLKHLYDF